MYDVTNVVHLLINNLIKKSSVQDLEFINYV